MSNSTPFAAPSGLLGNANAVAVTELGRTYQSRQGADSAALKLALRHSVRGLARRVPFAENAYTAAEGGPAFELTILVEGYGVREVPAAELARRVQSGLRREIDRLLDEAGRSAARAKQLLGSTFATRHVKDAAEYRQRARELETQVTVNVARAV